jgi:surfeit locus 1 family protein
VTLRLPTPAMIVLLLAALGVLIALGAWQFGRHQEKQELGDRLGGRTEAPPIELARADATPPLAELDFRRVRVAGEWDMGRALVVTNRVRFGTRGEQLVVPLLPADGGPAVLVDRGWYPIELREEMRARVAEEPTGVALGMARDLSGGSARLVASAGWTAFRPASMAEALPYPVVAWGLIEGAAPLDTDRVAPPARAELPQTGYVPFRNTIPHMQYALTWWGLAATLAVVAVLRLWIVPLRQARAEGRGHGAPGPTATGSAPPGAEREGG